ncbi:hypothetical protein GcC1_160011 [Golovinomyces cichoracearum]|uniref:Uncharacterized protein n=1 Tax=Golovinomyces cichoracearum TaxID=62708 RepID=A0A420HU97_9PEZI|nr:hypothetical protein GcC1_160011 [Golovinomyces cichoracearum]
MISPRENVVSLAGFEPVTEYLDSAIMLTTGSPQSAVYPRSYRFCVLIW